MRSVFFAVISLLLAVSCSKNVAGPQGDPGEPGKMGNAKQKSVTIKVDSSSWSPNLNYFTNSIFLPDITDDLIARGEARVYVKLESQWWNLPYAVEDVIMQMSLEKGIVRLKYYKIHNGPPAAPGSYSFRIITFVPA
jgi:hypothetical protein